ncbi:MAG: hypothetical protein GY862_19655 [Gammaproteobacteria bacterium]|nr:hypothetical protein [Gammaproteobacteria bacterium]
MKKLLIMVLAAFCIASLSIDVSARKRGRSNDKVCTPTNIKYCKAGKNWRGKKFSTYVVRCSDGTKRTITAWNKRKKWCVRRNRHCTNDQLKTAKKACTL